jgi:hypothetical protein
MERKRWAVANGAALGEEEVHATVIAFARAYWLGFRRAKAQMRRELDAMARRLDDELAGLEDEQRAAREQVARSIDDELDGVRAKMQGMRNEYRRWQAVERAIDTERDPDLLLN